MKEVYQMSRNELFEKYGTATGLDENQVKCLLEEYGENIITEQAKKSTAAVFLAQFADLLVIILLAAAAISMLSGNAESTIVIVAVIFLNAILGTMQYIKAENSLDSLRELSAPKVKVLRDNIKKEIASKDVVPSDLMLLEAGDMIVADGRIISNYSLQVNESALTGESVNIDKSDTDISHEAALGDRLNMVYSGSLVTYGRADVLVTATGMNTELGKIASLMNKTKNKKTPLQVSLDNFTKKLAVIIMIICVIVFLLGMWQGENLLDSLMFAVALAVAAIPEALSSIVTIVQAMGTRKMAADKAIMKELKAVESLGCVSVICSDKTGTLTQNRMTVQNIYINNECLEPVQLDPSQKLHRYLMYNAILNNDSSIRNGKDIGDPTETCLLSMINKTNLFTSVISYDDIRNMMPRLEEIPFDSDRKLMSSKYLAHGVPTVFTKGAVDVLLERIEYIETKDGIRKITESDIDNIIRQNEYFSENGLRVLAFAYKECPKDEALTADKEYGYTFTGLVSMMDPPREESMQAVSDAIRAGMKPIMITGDHKVTATAIAKQIGIFHDGDIAVTGQQLDKMSDSELDNEIEKISVYARVSPENKIRIVDAWQKKGNIVAMTGDGVNDAPALKKADIGIAMGITGTEVSKDAAAMILADDNFATIIKAVLNGRNVYRNIMNAIQFLLSGNLAAILVVLYCSITGLSAPFMPVQLLFINLLTDSLPALAIGMEPSDNMLLKQKPRNPKTGILTKHFTVQLAGYGILIGAVTLAAYYYGSIQSPEAASTMAFATLTLSRLLHGFNCRSSKSIFEIKPTSNKWSIAAFATGVILLAFVLLAPFMHNLFLVVQLSLLQYLVIAGFSILPLLVIQGVRVIKKMNNCC